MMNSVVTMVSVSLVVGVVTAQRTVLMEKMRLVVCTFEFAISD